MASEYPLIAYRVPGFKHYPYLIPASANRAWMDHGTLWHPRLGEPLLASSNRKSSGWFILNDADVEILWGGKTDLDSLKILTSDGRDPEYVHSMFGYGIVTFA